MKELITATLAFNNLDPLSKSFINKRANRIQIEDAIIQARTIGITQWKSQTGIPNKWAKIVEEIVSQKN